MKLVKIFIIAAIALFSTTLVAEAQERTERFTLGDTSRNEFSDSVDFDINAPILTEGDGTLYHIRKINLHGVKYLNHDILKQSAGLIEGDSIYLPSSFISNAMHRLWAPRYFSDIQIGATIEGDSVDLEVFLKERARILRWRIEGVSKSKEKDLFVEITDAGVKDIILPGEIREIMNTVLVAEKRAQANVITRREEVASTRSLLNTAKLMDENQTLYKLKELEYVERICENVGNISLNGNGNILSQLTEILSAK